MIKKVVNGADKAVSRIVKKSYNLFDADIFLMVAANSILYNKDSQTITVSNAYANNTGRKLKEFAPCLEVGKTYVLYFSATAKNNYLWLTTAKSAWTIGRTRTITEDDLNSNVIFYGEVGKTHTLSKFLIVEGAETKPYVPYLLDIAKVKKVVDVTDQMTNSKGNYYWNAENQEWTGAHLAQKEFCHVGNAKPIFEKYGLQRYVMEFDGRSEIAGAMYVYSLSGGNYGYTIGTHGKQFTTDWQHYEVSFVPSIQNNSTEGSCSISFFSAYGTGRIPHIKNFRIRTAVDVFTHVTSEVADGVIEVSPAKVTDGVLTVKGDNVKVENNKLMIK